MKIIPSKEHETELSAFNKPARTLRYIRVDEQNSEANTAILEITNYPKFNGIKYFYTDVGFEDGDGEEVKLRFTYDIVETPLTMDIETFSDRDMEEFDTLLGDVLVSFVMSNTAKGTLNADN